MLRFEDKQELYMTIEQILKKINRELDARQRRQEKDSRI